MYFISPPKVNFIMQNLTGIKIRWPLSQLPSKFGEGPQTEDPNGPWKCGLISTPDV